ncbi:DNA polymerase III subunit delta [Blochmannia endosymbiont of Colobopsis nipponica]|uniref:DNA polymerase III subunit delta n=1 Tax=Blochmannia endosymbiont of Colobopsis nipponica TaxID=2681987 RepID=UPI00178752F7|nr:DNA polymerase III subunit delta [Blochmannia endosymbiont of Colobopsis nipponica]QOI11128.1 DNA polymerase III subunit delta [Blochmannia endosymbiont of Colobopsis nipponica]
MIYLYPEELDTKLINKINIPYILYGNDLYLLQETKKKIFKTAKNYNFRENYNFILNEHTDWDHIINICKTLNLFSCRKILFFTLTHNYYNKIIDKNLSYLISFINNDLLFIIHINQLNENIKKYMWFKIIHKKSILINCNAPKNNHLLNWILNKTKKMDLSLEQAGYHLLCKYYKNNLFDLMKILENLCFIYDKKKVSLIKIQNIINENINFTPSHWISSVLSGKYQLACYILQKLKLEDADPIILLRKIQQEVIFLIRLKRQNKREVTPNILLNEYKIYKTKRQFLLTKAFKRLNQYQLNASINIMIQLELRLKKNEICYDTWNKLEILTTLLCM